MKFCQIEAQQCGAVTGLRIAELQPGLNVVLGPNGSGKTSLLRFVRDLLAESSSPAARGPSKLPSAGAVEVDDRAGPVRVVRIARSGHPDTVAVVAPTAAVSDQFNAASHALRRTESDSLLRFVESTHLHQAPALARLAAEVTAQLCHHEQGDCWPLICATAEAAGDRPRSPLSILWSLPDSPDGDPRLDCNLAVLDANWRTAASALERQREQLALECEARTRIQMREQREWATRLRWLSERAAEQSATIDRLDADWQALHSDLAASLVAPATTDTSSLSEDLERRLLLLRQVLEDLTRDRLDISLQMAHAPAGTRAPLGEERRRIEGCETEVIHQIQRLLNGRDATSHVCAHCGTPQPAVREQHSSDEQRCGALQQELFAARSQLAEIGCQLSRAQAFCRRSGLDPQLDRLHYDMQVLDAQIVEIRERRSAELIATAIATRNAVVRRHDLLRRAGDFLSELTAGRYTALRWDREQAELLADDSTGEPVPVGALSRGTSEHVAMSLRLTILIGLEQLGDNGPILWDEPLADSDETRLDAAAALLGKLAGQSMQLLLFTCREHVARALEAHGARVHTIGLNTAAALPAIRHVEETDPEVLRPAAELPRTSVRVHPSSTYWLHVEAPLELVPSLGPQFARRLRSLGLADVRQLLDYDPADASQATAELQIAPAQIQIWQAEARLLTEVPGITGRDAQLLVSSGLLSRTALAHADVDDLTHRIDRLRGGDTLRWRMGPCTAPHRETIERWVDSARHAPPADPVTRGNDRIRRRPERNDRPGRVARPQVSSNPPAVASRFRLQPDNPIVDAPSIGHKTARRLERIGITTVRGLLACDPQQTAVRLRHRRITRETVQVWQQQASLMCSVPELRCADAIVLVACGITGPLDLRRISPAALQATIAPFVAGESGRRLLRGANPPSAADVARWVETVEESRLRRAA